MSMTENELLEAIQEALLKDSGSSGHLTMNEISEATGMSYKRVTAVLHRLKKEGRLEIKQVYRETLSGRMAPSPAYRILS